MMRLRKTLETFSADETGGISTLMLPLFVLLMVVTGLAIDLMMHETERADLQNSLDRGTLAAASRTQTSDQIQVINDYVNKRPMAQGNDLSVQVGLVANQTSRSVDAEVKFDMPTAFAWMVNRNYQFPVPAVSRAIEGGEEIEISLVLDISGSMSRENAQGLNRRRLDELKRAAKEFVTEMLTGDNRQKVSISLVPYSGSTNAGPFFDELLNGSRDHNDSYCIEFTDEDYTYTGLPSARSRGQVPQFQYFRFEKNYGNNAEWGWCPTDGPTVGTGPADDLLGILPFSKDEAELHRRIDAFHAHDGTGTQIAMKWGLALLDPTTQPIIQKLASPAGGNVVSAEFANRPAPFRTDGVDKILVVMTDGRIRFQNRPKPEELEDPARRDFWAYEDIETFSNGFKIALNKLSLVWTNRGINNPPFTIQPDSTLLNADEARRGEQFKSLCALAKQVGVRVFTIGFDIESSQIAQDQMGECASSESDFFSVEGKDLGAAFDQIASVVQALRLAR